MVLFLGAAFVAEYFLKLYLHENALASYVGRDSAFTVPVAAIVGAPLYLDGYAALPLVRGLIEHGMAEGAAMAFLIAGGITSAWTALPGVRVGALTGFYHVRRARGNGVNLIWLDLCSCDCIARDKSRLTN